MVWAGSLAFLRCFGETAVYFLRTSILPTTLVQSYGYLLRNIRSEARRTIIHCSYQPWRLIFELRGHSNWTPSPRTFRGDHACFADQEAGYQLQPLRCIFARKRELSVLEYVKQILVKSEFVDWRPTGASRAIQCEAH